MWFPTRTLLLTGALFMFLVVVDCSKKTGDDPTTKDPKDKDIKKKISSNKAKNGGNKGPMSGGGGSWEHTFPVGSLSQLPLPIPKKKKQKSKKQTSKQQKRIGKSKKREGKKPRNARVKEESVNANPDKNKRSTIELLDSSEVIRRMRREVDESAFSDEERQLRDEWLGLDTNHEHNIPSMETASFVPRELKFLYDAGQTLADAYETIMPKMKARLKKRSVKENEDQEEGESEITTVQMGDDLMSYNDDFRTVEKREITDYDLTEEDLMSDEDDIARDMRAREVSPADEGEYSDDVTEIVNDGADYLDPIHHTIVTREASNSPNEITVAEAQQKVEDVKTAAAALDAMLEKMGINKETLVEDTHNGIEKVRQEKQQFQDRFRRHIIHARDLVDAPVHRRSDIVALKRSLEDDQNKMQEISAEEETLNKIELQAASLWVAEWSAKQRADETLKEAIQNGGRTSINQPPAVKSETSTPTNISPPSIVGTHSLAEMNAGQGSPIPSIMRQAVAPPVAAPMFTTITLQPGSHMAPVASFFEPQRTYQQPAPSEIHEIGLQRHFDTAPNLQAALPSVLYQPHLENHIQGAPLVKPYELQRQNYGQPAAYNRLSDYGQMVRQNYQMFKSSPVALSVEQNHGLREQPRYPSIGAPSALQYFKQKPAVLAPAPQPYSYHPQPINFQQQQLRQQYAYAQQKHYTNRPLQPIYPAKQSLFAPVTSPINPPYNLITAFAGNGKVTKPDHHHSSTTDSNSDGEKDSLSGLWFPGTTFSPPPSWLKAQNVHEPSNSQPSVSNQPSEQVSLPPHQNPVYTPVMPFIAPPVHPEITEIAGKKHIEGMPGVVAPFSSLKPYNPFTQQQQQQQQQQQPVPMVNQFITPLGSVPAQAYTAPQRPEIYGNIPVSNNFASPQNSAHEIIQTGPATETITINHTPAAKVPVKPLGELPGWLGAVDAKYDKASTDRMRPDQNEKNDTKKEEEAQSREFQKQPTQTESDVKKANIAVTGITNELGFDPQSISTLIEGVKTNAKREISLSKAIIEKTQAMEHEFCSAENSDSTASIAQRAELDKRSEIRGTACKNVELKLKNDHAGLVDAQNRLDNINKLETVVTATMVAQYVASERAASGGAFDISALTRAARSSPLIQN